MKASKVTIKEKNNGPERRCPGERYGLTEAICKARQANDYPKCLMCPFYEGTPDDFAVGDPKIKKSIFRSSHIAGEMPDEINEYVMRKIGAAAGQYLKARNRSQGTVVLACDKREPSRNLSRIFGEGLKSSGMKAAHIGPAMPDMLHYAMVKNKGSSAAFISGCHARLEVNGIRFIQNDGAPMLFNSGIEKIGLIAHRMRPGRSHSHDKNETLRVLPDYRSFMIEQTPQLQPLKVVIDGSSGIGGEVIPYVLAKTPLKSIKSHCEPEGKSKLLGLRFPAGQVNTSVQQAIRSEEAHLGMAIDYDGDMCVFYDEQGMALRSDVAGTIIAREILEQKPQARIAYDLRSTAAFREEILRKGGRPLRSRPLPDRLNAAILDKSAEYAFDLSGRHMFKAFSGGESPLLALMMVCSAVSRQQKPLSSIVEALQRYSYSGLITHEMPTPEKAFAAVNALIDEFVDCEKDELDGITFRFPTWWFYLKHTPESRIIDICVEGRTADEERAGRDTIEEIIRGYQNRL